MGLPGGKACLNGGSPTTMLFLEQLRGELRKLFARPRTWMGYGAFITMEAVILFVYKLDRSQM